jgi:beta-mannosidase
MISRSLVDFPYPNGMKELSYVTGLSSADLCMREVEELRRAGKDRPLGVLMRCMNDPWPSVSPSSIDYYGNKKPLHFYERDFLSPVRISAVRNGTRISFVVSNDTRQDYVGVFAYQIMNNENKAVFRDSFPIRARAVSNLEVHNVDIGSVIRGHEDEYYVSYSVANKCRDTSKGLLLFTNIKRFKFKKPNFLATIDGVGMEYTVTVSADCFAKGVEVSFDGEDVTLDNNYFDITGPAPVCVKVTAKRATSIIRLRRLMKVRSVMDLGSESDPS